MVLFVSWLLERGVWLAPFAVVLYLAIPDRQRPAWGPGVVGALVAVFVLNLFGVYPGPPRVTCTFDHGCARTADATRVGIDFRHGRSIAHSPLPIAESTLPGDSARVPGLILLGHPPRWAWELPSGPRPPRPQRSVGTGLLENLHGASGRPGVPFGSVGVEVTLPQSEGGVIGGAASTPPYVGPPAVGRPTPVGTAAMPALADVSAGAPRTTRHSAPAEAHGGGR